MQVTDVKSNMRSPDPYSLPFVRGPDPYLHVTDAQLSILESRICFKVDPDLHYFWKLDQDMHLFEKPDPH